MTDYATWRMDLENGFFFAYALSRKGVRHAGELILTSQSRKNAEKLPQHDWL